MGFRLAYLHLALVILKVKFTYILTVNISQRVKDKADITIVIKYEVTHGLPIGIFTFYINRC